MYFQYAVMAMAVGGAGSSLFYFGGYCPVTFITESMIAMMTASLYVVAVIKTPFMRFEKWRNATTHLAGYMYLATLALLALLCSWAITNAPIPLMEIGIAVGIFGIPWSFHSLSAVLGIVLAACLVSFYTGFLPIIDFLRNLAISTGIMLLIYFIFFTKWADRVADMPITKM